jgi:hypothetical protein
MEVYLKESKEKEQLKLKEEWQIKKSVVQMANYWVNGCSCVFTEDRYQKDRCRGQLQVSPPS